MKHICRTSMPTGKKQLFSNCLTLLTEPVHNKMLALYMMDMLANQLNNLDVYVCACVCVYLRVCILHRTRIIHFENNRIELDNSIQNVSSKSHNCLITGLNIISSIANVSFKSHKTQTQSTTLLRQSTVAKYVYILLLTHYNSIGVVHNIHIRRVRSGNVSNKRNKASNNH